MIEYAINKKNIKDIDVKNKRVLVRVDLNVPLDNMLNVRDTTKIDGVVATIQYLLDHQASIILISHLGRPGGEVHDRMRLKPVIGVLEKRLLKSIKYLKETIGPNVREEVKKLKPGDILLLENIRFIPEEESNSPEFAKELASYADIFVNDAFGTLHREHTSTCGISNYLPSVSGLLVEKEIKYFSNIFRSPKKPFALVLGGSKVSTKIGIINNLFEIVDIILIGGGMCFTFLKAIGYEIGKSLCEDEKLEIAKEILKKSKKNGVELVLPLDFVVVPEITLNAPRKTLPIEKMTEDLIAVDIGSRTIRHFKKKLKNAKTVLWNGPMGIFEMAKFAKGTTEIAKIISKLKHATTLVGGGESVMAINSAEVYDKITHVSTGGGATLEFLEGNKLPGIVSLLDSDTVN